jgi:creatinine amidohydrolase
MPKRPSIWLHELSWPEIERHLKHDDVALVPIGATEQHGLHLPLMTDTGWAIVAAEGAAQKAGALAAPPLHVGWSPHHMGFPGSLTLRPETLTQVTLDTCESLVCHGFRRIVIVNGNRIANLPPLEIAASKLRHSTGAQVVIADVGLIAKEEVDAVCTSAPGGQDHAGESETAFMLAWRPDLVDMAKAVTEMPKRRSAFHESIEFEPAYYGNSISVVRTAADKPRGPGSTGVSGDARAATPEKGERIIAAIVDNLARLIEEIRAAPLGEVRAQVPS